MIEPVKNFTEQKFSPPLENHPASLKESHRGLSSHSFDSIQRNEAFAQKSLFSSISEKLPVSLKSFLQSIFSCSILKKAFPSLFKKSNENEVNPNPPNEPDLNPPGGQPPVDPAIVEELLDHLRSENPTKEAVAAIFNRLPEEDKKEIKKSCIQCMFNHRDYLRRLSESSCFLQGFSETDENGQEIFHLGLVDRIILNGHNLPEDPSMNAFIQVNVEKRIYEYTHGFLLEEVRSNIDEEDVNVPPEDAPGHMMAILHNEHRKRSIEIMAELNRLSRLDIGCIILEKTNALEWVELAGRLQSHKNEQPISREIASAIKFTLATKILENHLESLDFFQKVLDDQVEETLRSSDLLQQIVKAEGESLPDLPFAHEEPFEELLQEIQAFDPFNALLYATEKWAEKRKFNLIAE